MNNAVVSIMNADEFLVKGMTDNEGRFLSSVNVSGVSQLEVYANKGGFIQGHTSAVIQSASSDFSISNITVQSENGSNKPALGELINFTLELENNSGSSTNAFTGEIVFSNGA